jgi:hypothetical protein
MDVSRHILVSRYIHIIDMFCEMEGVVDIFYGLLQHTF